MLKSESKRIKIICLIVFALFVFAGAWNCDDAFHGFVMSRNFANGNGFVYNIGERVNASTCALFDLILGCLYVIFGHMEVLSFVVCAIFSISAFALLLFKICESKYMPVVVLITCDASYTFMSYTTSGLENSLLFLLEILFLIQVLKKDYFYIKDLTFVALTCSAILLTRLDVGLLVFLPTAYIFLFKKKCTWFQMILAGFIGLLPFFLWEIFSAFYYGAFFPNTYYAKVTTNLPIAAYLYNGFRYYLVSWLFDLLPLTLIVFITTKLLFSKNVKYITLGVGVIIKMIYIAYVGGDFMVGRHFADLMLYTLAIGCYIYETNYDLEYKCRLRKWAFVIIVFCIATTIITSRLINNTMMWPVDNNSCADEREYYYSTLGAMPRLYNYLLTQEDYDIGFSDETESLLRQGSRGDIIDFASGQIVYKYGEQLYLSDKHGLGDPLLSKLPAIDEETFRTGHMIREIPEGYRESIASGTNLIVDPGLHEYYDRLLFVIRGDLWVSERIHEAVKLSFGEYDYLLKDYVESLKNSYD